MAVTKLDRTPLQQAQARMDALISMLSIFSLNRETGTPWLREFIHLSDYPGIVFDSRAVLNHLAKAGLIPSPMEKASGVELSELFTSNLARTVIQLVQYGSLAVSVNESTSLQTTDWALAAAGEA